jgi:hypothetical protein
VDFETVFEYVYRWIGSPSNLAWPFTARAIHAFPALVGALTISKPATRAAATTAAPETQ